MRPSGHVEYYSSKLLNFAYVQEMPSDVLDDSGVAGEDGLGVDDLVLLGRAVDVPEADSVVVRGREEVPVQVRVPAEAVALLLVAAQAQVGVALEWERGRFVSFPRRQNQDNCVSMFSVCLSTG